MPEVETMGSIPPVLPSLTSLLIPITLVFPPLFLTIAPFLVAVFHVFPAVFFTIAPFFIAILPILPTILSVIIRLTGNQKKSKNGSKGNNNKEWQLFHREKFEVFPHL